MVRHFAPDPVAPEGIDRILDAARHAPSAGFTQGQSFVVVTKPDLRQAIGRICGEQEYVAGGYHPFISGAPVLLIPCTSEAAYHRRYWESDKLDESGNETEWPVPYGHMDIGCSVMLVLLAAVNEGLAAGFAGAPTSAAMQELRDLLGIPAEVTPVGVIPIGHRAPDVPSPSLKQARPQARRRLRASRALVIHYFYGADERPDGWHPTGVRWAPRIASTKGSGISARMTSRNNFPAGWPKFMVHPKPKRFGTTGSGSSGL